MKAFVARKLISRFAEQPLFIVGTGRSGTTVLLQGLGAHPLVFAASGEAPLIAVVGDLMAKLEAEDSIVHAYLGASIRIPRDTIYAHLKRLNFEIAFGSHYGLRRVVKQLLKTRKPFVHRGYWAAKVFPSEESCRGLRCLYPAARFVYVVRNGMNVVQSRMHFSGFKHATFADHCHNWQTSNERFGYLENIPCAVRVYHEQLLEDPEACFSAIFNGLNIPYDGEPAHYVKTNLIHPLNENHKKGVDARQILKSRPAPYETWTEEQKQVFIDICSPGMQQHGYEIPFA